MNFPSEIVKFEEDSLKTLPSHGLESFTFSSSTHQTFYFLGGESVYLDSDNAVILRTSVNLNLYSYNPLSKRVKLVKRNEKHFRRAECQMIHRKNSLFLICGHTGTYGMNEATVIEVKLNESDNYIDTSLDIDLQERYSDIEKYLSNLVYGFSVIYQRKRDRLLIFGGYSLSGGDYLNKIVTYDFVNKEWEMRKVGLDYPCKRGFQSFHLFSGNLAVMFGGYSASSKYLNDLYTYDIENNYWNLLKCSGDIPEKTCSHGSVVYNSNLFIFGGLNRDLKFTSVKHNSEYVYKLNLTSLKWCKYSIDTLVSLFHNKLGIFYQNDRVYILSVMGRFTTDSAKPSVTETTFIQIKISDFGSDRILFSRDYFDCVVLCVE